MDLIIRKGAVIDGSGNPWFRADVAIEGERIVGVGDLSSVKADKVIDANGFTVSPGFVDVHSHSDFLIVADPSAENKLMQGITFDCSGLCARAMV